MNKYIIQHTNSCCLIAVRGAAGGPGVHQIFREGGPHDHSQELWRHEIHFQCRHRGGLAEGQAHQLPIGARGPSPKGERKKDAAEGGRCGHRGQFAAGCGGDENAGSAKCRRGRFIRSNEIKKQNETDNEKQTGRTASIRLFGRQIKEQK